MVNVFDAAGALGRGVGLDVGSIDAEQGREDVASVPTAVIEDEHKLSLGSLPIGNHSQGGHGPQGQQSKLTAVQHAQ